MPHLNYICPIQVHSKESEIGVGEYPIALSYDSVEHLPWMYVLTFPIGSQNPYPIMSFATLIYPFDGYVWAFTIGSCACVLSFLCLIQKLWSRSTGENPPTSWLFEGDRYLFK